MDGLLMAEGELRVVIGVSGGADSICLLFLMKDILPAENIRVIHINHMIRGDEADADSRFVEEICRREGLFFKEIRKDIPALSREMGYTEEEAGRRIRYECFEKEAEDWEAECGSGKGKVRIAVAHHVEDNAETVLFNLFRGTGIRGLSGIAPERGRIIRPLLSLTRDDIEDYLRYRGESFRTDRTNEDNAYSRNRIRNLILPQAKAVSPAAAEHIAAASGRLRKILEYLDGKVDESIDRIVTFENGAYRIDREGLCSLDDCVASMLVLRLLTELTPMKKDIGEVHAAGVLELARTGPGRHADLPYGIKADVSHDQLLLRRKVREDDPDSMADDVEALELFYRASDLTEDEVRALTDKTAEGNRYTKYFDYDKICYIASKQGIKKDPPYEFRARRDGDFLRIKKSDGSPATKSLGDYLTDLKLPADEKEKIRVCAVGSEVLWVIGYRMGDSAKLSPDTGYILRLEVKGHEGTSH
ncbi:MAG: tRNA lysidine(34) synthetase TilS [Lachnospiraceae bacterium]|nr:tRNA lysidine(34) synthetase TilS [Lachnospiraceae bacterium]